MSRPTVVIVVFDDGQILARLAGIRAEEIDILVADEDAMENYEVDDGVWGPAYVVEYSEFDLAALQEQDIRLYGANDEAMVLFGGVK